jgi:hypothetical protein
MVKEEVMQTHYNIKTEIRNGNTISVITPTTAEKIFKERCSNRPLHLPTARIYAKAMEVGKWKASSQISFCNGRLDDGQHRMMASMISGKDFEGSVYYHDEPDTFAVFDSGRKRSNADVLSINGKKYGQNLSSCLQVLEKINSKSGLPKGVGGQSRVLIQPYEIMDVLDKYPDVEYSVAQVYNNQKYNSLPSASASALHYVIRKALGGEHKHLVDIFIVDKLFKGLELKEDDPVYALRKHLQNLKRICTTGAQAIPHHDLFFGGIHIWNKWIVGKPCRLLRIPNNITHTPEILIPKKNLRFEKLEDLKKFSWTD